ncbi:hypothetical protein ACFOOM_34045, partial [Streptomyces echinoruber]|uniref:hypothetical protein n=1 Tax=Streptomyces echinoruber TaxID=68898 RepID=UPI003619F96A
AAPGGPAAARGSLWLPVAWTAVTLHAPGARLLRVRLGSTPDGTRCLDAVDEFGDPVLTVASVRCAPVDVAGDTESTGAAAGRQERFLDRVWDEVLRPLRPERAEHAERTEAQRELADRVGRGAAVPR